MEYFSYVLILLGCSVIFIAICHRLHLPPIIGYLLVGVLVGPGGLHWLPDIEEMHLFAEFGVVFLMFTIGLEFSMPKLTATKKEFFSLGGLQVGICTLVGCSVFLIFNLDLRQAFIISGALALSSTAIVAKQLSEQKEQHTAYGHLSINILIFQDIAAVLFLILIPAIAGDSTNLWYITFLITFVKGIIITIGTAVVGLWILKPLFHEVAKAKSEELSMITALLIVLSAAGVTYYSDFPMALGAFLAGLMLGETEFKTQIILDIRPFRDVLLGLFFVIIGTNLELDQLSQHWQLVLIILFGLITIKTLIIILITKFFNKMSTEIAIRTSIILAHGGEFSFVLLKEAFDHNIVQITYKESICTAIVFSTLLAPLIVLFNKTIANFLLGKTIVSTN